MPDGAANAVRRKRAPLAGEVRQLRADLDALRARVSSLEVEVDDVREEVEGISTSDLESRLDEIETAAAVRATEWKAP